MESTKTKKKKAPENGWTIRLIEPRDDRQVEALIRAVMTEQGASGPGFSINDPEVKSMSQAYSGEDSAYFVLVDGDKVLGGSGIGHLRAGAPSVCELRKMYFLKEARGQGYGKKLLDVCLEAAKERGYRKCYLETLKSMESAQKLYEEAGFTKLKAPVGNTGHFKCDAWYEKEL